MCHWPPERVARCARWGGETSPERNAERPAWLAARPGGEVRCQGKGFAAIEDSPRAHLFVDADSLEEVVEGRKALDGVRLDGR
ncbi:uncharacterized protein SOCEGT47_009250 [Sorangium cellulosum]|uniref:Uncharacterized protein n=1 Tax=Sorangium cellulosum TaxID=56 RepID=A0A4P2PUU6_SORCE|nr:uncharacterized protein SOCEGT47_009250 [Sorangium cellulosum]